MKIERNLKDEHLLVELQALPGGTSLCFGLPCLASSSFFIILSSSSSSFAFLRIPVSSLVLSILLPRINFSPASE